MATREDYERFFTEADTDGSGSLSSDELKAILKKKGYKGSDVDLDMYFAQTDKTGDGKISKDEYLKAMGQIPEEQHGKSAAIRVFESFDKDGSGQIDKTELKAVFQEMGKYFSDAEIARMIEIVDKDGSATLNCEEFCLHCFGHK